MRIVAILPAYNLEQGIEDIVRRTLVHVDQVIVVADASRDHTGDRARTAGAIVPEYSGERGKGRALIRGIAAARKLAPEVVVLLDADGQHLPEEIPRLLEPLRTARADVVSGSRFRGKLRTSLVNRFGNTLSRNCIDVLSASTCNGWI